MTLGERVRAVVAERFKLDPVQIKNELPLGTGGLGVLKVQFLEKLLWPIEDALSDLNIQFDNGELAEAVSMKTVGDLVGLANRVSQRERKERKKEVPSSA